MTWEPRTTFKKGHEGECVCVRRVPGRAPRMLYEDGIGWMGMTGRKPMYMQPGAAQLMCDVLNRENAVLGKSLSEKFGTYDQLLGEHHDEN